MNTTIIFTLAASGHYIEYFHHIYEVCLSEPDTRFVFFVPESFKVNSCHLTWVKADNIIFEFIDDRQANEILGLKKAKLQNLSIASILNGVCKQYNADKVFVNSISWLLPFTSFYLRKDIKISGIIYDIPIYLWKELSIKNKLLISISYLTIRFSSNYDNILFLNDENAANFLNKILYSKKFKKIVDPYTVLPLPSIDIRVKYHISDDKTIFSHFGVLSHRKGTLDILESIKLIPRKELDKYAFIFAGRILSDIRERFYKLVEELQSKVVIIVEEGFCSYDYIASLCKQSNALVIPYKECYRSSGLLGYASQFHIPVISSCDGLIGVLIKKFSLGIAIADYNIHSLCDAYRYITDNPEFRPNSDYCKLNTKSMFQAMIRVVIVK